MRHLILGLGEIGTSLMQTLKEDTAIDGYDLKSKELLSCDRYDVLHVCYPWHADFVQTTLDYEKKYTPKIIVIHSTVPVGTTREIAKHVPCLHMPVEGKHPNLAESMTFWTWPIGCLPQHTEEAGKIANSFNANNLKTNIVSNPDATEAMKILSTTKYGMDIIFARMQNRILTDLGIKKYDLVLQYTQAYNELYQKLGMEQFTRPLLTPSEEPIGGHCVKQNLELLEHPQMESIRNFILKHELLWD